MNKTVATVVAVVLVLAAFAGGAFLGPKVPFIASLTGTNAAGGRAFGGPMANLSADERAKIQNMSDSERQQYFQSKFGGQMPGGGQAGQNGASGGFRGPRTITIEGTVMDVAADSMTIKTTAGGSQTVYYDSKTTIAYAEGVSASDLAKGMKVLVIATPEADQVISATAVLVKESHPLFRSSSRKKPGLSLRPGFLHSVASCVY